MHVLGRSSEGRSGRQVTHRETGQFRWKSKKQKWTSGEAVKDHQRKGSKPFLSGKFIGSSQVQRFRIFKRTLSCFSPLPKRQFREGTCSVHLCALKRYLTYAVHGTSIRGTDVTPRPPGSPAHTTAESRGEKLGQGRPLTAALCQEHSGSVSCVLLTLGRTRTEPLALG